MINLQSGQERQEGMGPTTSQRLWLWAPIVAGGALSALLLLGLALPQGLEIGKVMQHLRELEQQRQELELLTIESEKTEKQRQEAKQRGEQLIQLVSGKTGDLSTVLATLDLEAKEAKVSLELYEPQSSGAAGPPGRDGRSTAPPQPPGEAASPEAGAPGGRRRQPPPDALAKAGLRERSLVLVASGTYPELLDFLRRMERLEVLVEQKNLLLSVEGMQPGQSRQIPPDHPTVEARVSLTLWSKEEPEERKKTPASPPSPVTAPPPAPPG